MFYNNVYIHIKQNDKIIFTYFMAVNDVLVMNIYFCIITNLSSSCLSSEY